MTLYTLENSLNLILPVWRRWTTRIRAAQSRVYVVVGIVVQAEGVAFSEKERNNNLIT
jgi:hypothetical protein